LKVPAVDDRERQRARDIRGQHNTVGLGFAPQSFVDIVDSLRTVETNLVIHALERGDDGVAVFACIASDDPSAVAGAITRGSNEPPCGPVRRLRNRAGECARSAGTVTAGTQDRDRPDAARGRCRASTRFHRRIASHRRVAARPGDEQHPMWGELTDSKPPITGLPERPTERCSARPAAHSPRMESGQVKGLLGCRLPTPAPVDRPG